MSKDLYTFYKFYDDGSTFKYSKIMTEEEKEQYLKDNPDFVHESEIKREESKSAAIVSSVGDWRSKLSKTHSSFYSMMRDKIKANAPADSLSRQKYS